MKSCEQQARDMLERMGVENSQEFSAGSLVELANLINDQHKVRQFALLEQLADDLARDLRVVEIAKGHHGTRPWEFQSLSFYKLWKAARGSE